MVKQVILIIAVAMLTNSLFAQSGMTFRHPGLAQSATDLQFMRRQVIAGAEPWKTAFDNLRRTASLSFKPQPVTHVSVGPYGANSKGGRELSESSDMAYRHALMWYITGKREYAQKAIEILNAWSYTLWDFDDNNAKLNVGLTAFNFLNAAEILKYTASGWQQKDIIQFQKLMLTVYYPTVRDFFTEANGNWDASIINTLLCIGVFTDKQDIFNSAIERYKRGPGNSGITKYIYSNGQVQETTRDWGHVQLGLGEFAKAAQVAWTQGTDLYADGDNRLSLGYEYTTAFLTGKDIPVYGVLSIRDRDELRDIYEAVYNHYTQVKGISMPNTLEIIRRTRPHSSTGVLTGIRKEPGALPAMSNRLNISHKVPANQSVIGAGEKPSGGVPKEAIFVGKADSLQSVLDRCKGKKSWIILNSGIYVLKAPLKIYSLTKLSGQGRSTVLTLAPGIAEKTMVNGEVDLHDVTIMNMIIEGANSVTTNPDPNHDRRSRSYMNATSREGIFFSADRAGQFNRLRFAHLTVQNFTKNGVAIRGANHILIDSCDFSDNGSSVVPGPGLLHNLQVSHASQLIVTNSRFDTSPWGNGISLSYIHDGLIERCEMARNKLSGLHCMEVTHLDVRNNLAEGNDRSGFEFEALASANKAIKIYGNLLQYNSNYGIQDSSKRTEKINNVNRENGKK
ncbi:alginate lyase family protein [Mucilaginibacter sp. PAMB04168]|uniref:alginate lyase family protein n=1 Tax=Mucilaginibacter sp. PAMB04168 TaxID=3138567 RepID=UPI0031F6595F